MLRLMSHDGCRRCILFNSNYTSSSTSSRFGIELSGLKPLHEILTMKLCPLIEAHAINRQLVTTKILPQSPSLAEKYENFTPQSYPLYMIIHTFCKWQVFNYTTHQ